MKKIRLFGLPSVFCAAVLLSCTAAPSLDIEPFTAADGRLDLSRWDPAQTAIIPLAGEWKITRIESDASDRPEYVQPGFDDSDWETVDVPGHWSRRYGSPYGFYILRLTLSGVSGPNEEPLGLFSGINQTSSEIYANGKRIISNGKPAADPAAYRPLKYPSYTVVDVREGTLVIAIKIANHHDYTMGIMVSPAFGTHEAVARYVWFMFSFLHLVCLGIILMMGILYAILWLQRRRYIPNLYFAVSAFGMFARELALNYFFEKLFVGDAIYAIHQKFEILGTIVGLLFFVMFCSSIFPRYFPKLVTRLTLGISSVFGAFVLASDPKLILIVSPYMQALMLVVFVLCVISLVRAAVARNWEAIILLVGFAILASVSIFMTLASSGDVVVAGNKYVGFNFVPIALVLFLVSQSIVLSLRFTNAYATAEHLTENLQKEVGEKTRTLTLQKDELAAANKKLRDIDVQKTRFLENISHETKTPLTLVLGPIEAMLAGRYGELSTSMKAELSLILRNGKKLYRLLSQLISLSKLEQGRERLRVAQHDIVKLLRYWLASYESAARQKGIELAFASALESVGIFCDVSAMEMVFTNLISNGIKFTDAGGRVTIGVGAPADFIHPGADWPWDSPWPESVVRVTVSDTGAGIPPEELPHIFDRFHQVDGSSTRKHEGSGIGLALVREYAALHRAAVGVSSRVGSGTTFTVDIPLGTAHLDRSNVLFISDGEKSRNDPADEAIERPLVEPSREARRTTSAVESADRILIVDDNDDMREFLASGLDAYSVSEARNGREALEATGKIKPDLIVSDIMMPEMDGYELCRMLAGDPRTADIPVLFLTAKSDAEEERAKGLGLGAVDFIHKPFSITELVAKIESILRQKRIQRLLSEKDRFDAVGVLFGGLSHEILNPLGGVHAHVEILEGIVARQDEPKVMSCFRAIHRNLDRIETLVKNFRTLFFAREIRRERLDAATIDRIIAGALDTLSDTIDTRTALRRFVANGFTATGNEEALSHIILNLVKNAVESIEGTGEVNVRAEHDNGLPSIVVSDTGTGIPEENIEKIFEPFFTTKDIGKGLGLGLYFVKSLTGKMGWSVTVRSKPGEGSQFILRGMP